MIHHESTKRNTNGHKGLLSQPFFYVVSTATGFLEFATHKIFGLFVKIVLT